MNDQDWHDAAVAERWDRRHLDGNPVRGDHLAMLADLLDEIAPATLLDLGCGSGIVADLLLERMPDVALVGVDSSQPMLELGRRRLERFAGRAALMEADLGADDLALGGPFDAAIAVQSLHHLETGQLAGLLRRARAALAPAGWLLVVDRVLVPGRELYGAFASYKRRTGHARNPPRWEEYVNDLAATLDRPQPLDAYLDMLLDAGFEAGCLDCRGDRAFLVARARERR